MGRPVSFLCPPEIPLHPSCAEPRSVAWHTSPFHISTYDFACLPPSEIPFPYLQKSFTWNFFYKAFPNLMFLRLCSHIPWHELTKLFLILYCSYTFICLPHSIVWILLTQYLNPTYLFKHLPQHLARSHLIIWISPGNPCFLHSTCGRQRNSKQTDLILLRYKNIYILKDHCPFIM